MFSCVTAKKINTGFNYSRDCYESVFMCVCVCLCMHACSIINAQTLGTLLQQKGALISPRQHGK